MTKKDFIRQLERKTLAQNLSYSSAVAVEMAEAAGVQWDPEEAPLPERIRFLAPIDRTGTVIENHEGSIALVEIPVRWDGDGEHDGLRRRFVGEVIRRWNAWPKLRALISGPMVYASQREAERVQLRLLAILDGKPEP